MKKIFLIFFTLISLFSCQNNDKKTDFVSPVLFTDCNIPIANFSINGNKYNFIIDSGSENSFISDDLFIDSCNFSMITDTIYTSIQTLDGTTGNRKLYCISVYLNDSIETKMYITNIDELTKNIFKKSGRIVKGIIGSDVLSNYKVTIDYKNKEIRFD